MGRCKYSELPIAVGVEVIVIEIPEQVRETAQAEARYITRSPPKRSKQEPIPQSNQSQLLPLKPTKQDSELSSLSLHIASLALHSHLDFLRSLRLSILRSLRLLSLLRLGLRDLLVIVPISSSSSALVLALRIAFAALLRRRGRRSRHTIAVATGRGEQLLFDGVEAGRGGSGGFVAHHFGEFGVVDLGGGVSELG